MHFVLQRSAQSPSRKEMLMDVTKRNKGGRKSTDTDPALPLEIWVHEDCAVWANGVYMAPGDGRLCGIEDAIIAASNTVRTRHGTRPPL